MIANSNPFLIPEAAYLEGERVSPIKHEYRRGQVYAMVGAKKPHVAIASNLVTLLNIQLRETPCLVLSSDIKVRLEAADCYYYPDVVVTCDQRDLTTTEDFIRYPTLVIEILSDSTEAFDRGEKFADYQTCPTLLEYMLVSQTERRVERFQLTESGWVQGETAEQLVLKSLGCQCQINEIYQKVPGF